MTAVQRYSRYGAIVGVFPSWPPLIFRIISYLTPKGAHGLGYLTQFMNQAIDEEAAAGEKPDASQVHLVSKMFAMHRQDPERFSQEDIRFHIVPSIGGGSDTTAITIGAVIYYLIKSPSVLHKLRSELQERRKDGRLSRYVKFKEAQECAYLQAIIKETMRIYPGNGLPMPRVIPEGGLMLAGRWFPAGVSSILLCPMYLRVCEIEL